MSKFCGSRLNVLMITFLHFVCFKWALQINKKWPDGPESSNLVSLTLDKLVKKQSKWLAVCFPSFTQDLAGVRDVQLISYVYSVMYLGFRNKGSPQFTSIKIIVLRLGRFYLIFCKISIDFSNISSHFPGWRYIPATNKEFWI